jgi:hypothetical protein
VCARGWGALRLVFSEERLRRFLAKYAPYFNEVRSHVSLGKDAALHTRN